MIHTKKFGKHQYHIQFGSGFQVCLPFVVRSKVWCGKVYHVNSILRQICLIVFDQPHKTTATSITVRIRPGDLWNKQAEPDHKKQWKNG